MLKLEPRNKVFVIRLRTNEEGEAHLWGGSSYTRRAIKTYSRVGDARRVLGRLRNARTKMVDETAAVLEVSLSVVEVH